MGRQKVLYPVRSEIFICQIARRRSNKIDVIIREPYMRNWRKLNPFDDNVKMSKTVINVDPDKIT